MCNILHFYDTSSLYFDSNYPWVFFIVSDNKNATNGDSFFGSVTTVGNYYISFAT